MNAVTPAVRSAALSLLMGRKSVVGSSIGGIAETQEVLDFAAEHNIVFDIELIDIKDVSNQLRIRVGAGTFTATLFDNATVTAFVARLPLTISMVELNGNEKYYDLPQALPTNAVSPGTIQAGDLLLYNSSTLVLSYEALSTSYRYTRLGRIDNPAGLAAALGRGNVTVTFELQ